MANEDIILKEVDQELAEDRQWEMFRKYGPAAIGAGLAIIAAVGAVQIWNARQDSVAKKEALQFKSAVDLLDDNAASGREALDKIFDDQGGGYSVLAEFRRAASFAKAGERTAAIVAFQKIYKDGGAPKRLRELARVRAGYLALDDGRDAVLGHLGDLPDAGGALSYYASEVAGLAAIEARDYESALSIFRRMSVDLDAPAALRQRAEEFAALAASGKAGVNLTGETRVDDILNALGEGDATQTDQDENASEDSDGTPSEGGEEAASDAAPAQPAESGNE